MINPFFCPIQRFIDFVETDKGSLASFSVEDVGSDNLLAFQDLLGGISGHDPGLGGSLVHRI